MNITSFDMMDPALGDIITQWWLAYHIPHTNNMLAVFAQVLFMWFGKVSPKHHRCERFSISLVVHENRPESRRHTCYKPSRSDTPTMGQQYRTRTCFFMFMRGAKVGVSGGVWVAIVMGSRRRAYRFDGLAVDGQEVNGWHGNPRFDVTSSKD